jgi:hypothetical protein
MIEIRAWTADFAQLVAAENAPNRGLGRFSARFIRRNQIRGHDENGPHHLEFVDRRTSPIPHSRASGTGLPQTKTSVETENGNHGKEDLPLEKGA